MTNYETINVGKLQIRLIPEFENLYGKHEDNETLDSSIRENGVLTPSRYAVIGGHSYLITGYRVIRACQRVGIVAPVVACPASVVDVETALAFRVGLVEKYKEYHAERKVSKEQRL